MFLLLRHISCCVSVLKVILLVLLFFAFFLWSEKTKWWCRLTLASGVKQLSCDAVRKQSRCLCGRRHAAPTCRDGNVNLNQESLSLTLICECCVINKVCFVSNVCVACCCSSPLQPRDGGDDVTERQVVVSAAHKCLKNNSVLQFSACFFHRFSYKGFEKLFDIFTWTNHLYQVCLTKKGKD